MSNGLRTTDTASHPPNGGMPATVDDLHRLPTIHRAASHTQLPGTTQPKGKPARTASLSRSFSENILSNTFESGTDNAITTSESKLGVRAHRSLKKLGSFKRRSIAQEPEPHFTISKFIIGANQSLEDVGYESSSHKATASSIPSPKGHSVSDTISTLARKSWVSTSRSPSPSPSKRRLRKEIDPADKSRDAHEPGVDSRPGADADHSSTQSDVKSNKSTRRRNSFLGSKQRRPLSSILTRTPNDLSTPSIPPIPKSYSTDRLPTSDHVSTTSRDTPALPTSKSFERFQRSGAETPRKKDELWNLFRNLDGEYQKFQSRPGTMKTAIIRSNLLPFLRAYADHPSTSSLRPEDLDRRTVILNKWWTGLLEMLNGRRGESVSGNDRPAVLEAVTALMTRPEWTLPSMSVATRSAKTPRASLKSRSTTSLGSTMTMSSDFLAESVYHNIRNSFTQNLLAQMAYVVDKMSSRNVAASVVAFCGKATAYAFFYCEGVAEILVRLWSTSSDTLKRVMTENGVELRQTLDPVVERIGVMFPLSTRSLTFRSLRSLTRHLRNRPHLPIATTYISWHGPWVSRWAGKDTDLFYVFVKFYTDLVCRFLPDNPSTEEVVVAPGWILVQAQVLSILDAIMQRMNHQPQPERSGPTSVTFDDMLGEANATAAVLPVPANSSARSMAENRLILLLRDCLSGSTIMTKKAQTLFAQSYCLLIKATARKISVFDHDACFTLCDFLEEALAILTRYSHMSEPIEKGIEWPFWIQVCRRMLQSQNIMTQVRLCSFLYAMWPTLIVDEAIKREMCLHWLLSEDIFETLFSHWCPMVRAFFMRLLVWRLARLDGSHSELDMSILKTLAHRLEETWGHFLFMQGMARGNNTAAPSAPAPGRRLLIMRNDVQPAPAGMFLSFDGILSSSSKTKNNPYEKHSSLTALPPAASSQHSESRDGRSASVEGKKRWSIFKTILPNAVSSSLKGISAQNRDHDESDGLHKYHNRPPPKSSGSKSVVDRSGDLAPFRSLSFKFSLEWLDRGDAAAGREELLHPPKLPILVHRYINPSEAPAADTDPLKPRDPRDPVRGPNKYTGKALAEWALLISECTNFFERRKAEGVPSYLLVETPTLGVEPFRKL